MKRDSISEEEITYRASYYAGYVRAGDWQTQASYQNAHKNQITGYGNRAVR